MTISVTTMGLSSPSAAGSAQLTDDEMCDLTPADGTWALEADLVDSELSILGTISHDVSIPGALAACSNRFEYFDGTNIVVAIYLMPSESDADAALSALKSSAEAAAPVIDFARPVLGDQSWIAQFDFNQVAFTRSGRFLIGGMSEESYDYSRADYSQLLIERMGVVVAAVSDESGSDPAPVAKSGDDGADSGGSGDAGDNNTTTGRSDTTDEGSPIPAVIRTAGLAALAGAGGVVLQRRRRRRLGRNGSETDHQNDQGDDQDDNDEDRSVALELTHPVGHSPHVLQYGWLFGAKAVVGAGTAEQRDVSDSVRWSGPATFDPPVGRLARPRFLDAHGGPNDIGKGMTISASITLSVDVGGTTTEKSFPVSVISTIGYVRVSDKSMVPSDAHGCPACPHTCVGPVVAASGTEVFLDRLPVATVGDQGVHASCCGPNMYTITSGDPRVLINGKPAAWEHSEVEHCGGVGYMISSHPGGS